MKTISHCTNLIYLTRPHFCFVVIYCVAWNWQIWRETQLY